MPKDFGQWMAEQGRDEPEPEEEYRLRCSCGKTEVVSRADYENGDTGWYSDDPESGTGICGGSQFCLP